MRVLNFGSLNIDYTYQIPHVTVEGETQAATSLKRYPGGKGLNQSIALARAGAEVFHAGAIGEDGQFLLDLLTENGVDIRFVERHLGQSGHAIVQVDECGHNGIFIFGGANRTIDVEQIDRTLSYFCSDDVLLVQNEISCLGELLLGAHKRGMRIVLNPSPMEPQVLELPLEHVSCLAVNETEAAALCGTDAREPGALSAQLAERFPAQDILLTLGAEGAYFLPANGDSVFEPARRIEAVDTTGAGDTFLGYFLASHLGGTDAVEALKLAASAAALCVTRQGASSSIPYLQEVISAQL